MGCYGVVWGNILYCGVVWGGMCLYELCDSMGSMGCYGVVWGNIL